MSEQPRVKLEPYEAALRQQPGGTALADAFGEHIEEVVALINRNRRVAVVWQRCEGPAFVRAAVENGVSYGVNIPQEVEGCPLEMLLLQMADALQSHGSPALRNAIAEHSLRILRMAREAGSLTVAVASHTEP
jgi:hypothetical protein